PLVLHSFPTRRSSDLRFHADLINAQTGDFGYPRAHRLPIRSDLGRFSNDRAIDVVDERATFPKRARGMREEQGRIRTFPACIGGDRKSTRLNSSHVKI